MNHIDNHLSSGQWSEELLAKAGGIKLLFLDVDGVLTDGSLLYTEDGQEAKKFNTQDGFGITLLHDSGVKTGIITARKSNLVARRVEELRFSYIFQGKRDKLSVLEQVVAENNISLSEIAYMGDDWLDLPVLCQVGLSAAPANASSAVKERVDYISTCSGGNGAVRELCELILESQVGLVNILLSYIKR